MYIPELATHMNFIWRQLQCYKLYADHIKSNSPKHTHTHTNEDHYTQTALEIRRLELKSQFHHKCCALEQVSFSLDLSFLICNTKELYWFFMWYYFLALKSYEY